MKIILNDIQSDEEIKEKIEELESAIQFLQGLLKLNRAGREQAMIYMLGMAHLKKYRKSKKITGGKKMSEEKKQKKEVKSEKRDNTKRNKAKDLRIAGTKGEKGDPGPQGAPGTYPILYAEGKWLKKIKKENKKQLKKAEKRQEKILKKQKRRDKKIRKLLEWMQEEKYTVSQAKNFLKSAEWEIGEMRIYTKKK